MTAPPQKAGHKFNCLKCGQRIQIPSPPRGTILARPLPDKEETPPARTPSGMTQARTSQPPAPATTSAPATVPLTPLPAKRSSPFVWLALSGAGLAALLLCICGGGGVFWFARSSKPGGVPLFGEPDYFPLRQGSKWEYDYELQVGLRPVQKGAMVVRIDGEEKIDGKTYLRVTDVITGIPGMDSEVGHVRSGEGGVYSRDKKTGEEELLLPRPAPVGKEWTWTHKTKQGKTTNRVEAIEDVPLIDQTYRKCLKVHSTSSGEDGETKGDAYYAPGIGVIKSVAVIKDPLGESVAITMTLKKYTP
jgi:hypothetical protein